MAAQTHGKPIAPSTVESSTNHSTRRTPLGAVLRVRERVGFRLDDVMRARMLAGHVRSHRAICARMTESLESLPLPDHPLLAAWASALNDAGYWAIVLDAEWRYVFVTDELRLSYRDMGAATTPPIGSHFFSAECRQFMAEAVPGAVGVIGGSSSVVLGHGSLRACRYARRPRGASSRRRSRTRRPRRPTATPRSSRRVDESTEFTTAGAEATGSAVWIRIDDARRTPCRCVHAAQARGGNVAPRPAAATADLAHLERMRVVERPDRRPAAILMADLEASSPLARRLSTAQYFAFGRRLVRTADRCVIDAGGIVGRHAGDGIVAFFLADTTGSESAAARACITAARNLRDTAPRHRRAQRALCSRVSPCGSGCTGARRCTWDGSSPAGRSEVTALGDEVNEAARIEACATGGRDTCLQVAHRTTQPRRRRRARTRHRSHDVHAARRPRYGDRQGTT